MCNAASLNHFLYARRQTKICDTSVCSASTPLTSHIDVRVCRHVLVALAVQRIATHHLTAIMAMAFFNASEVRVSCAAIKHHHLGRKPDPQSGSKGAMSPASRFINYILKKDQRIFASRLLARTICTVAGFPRVRRSLCTRIHSCINLVFMRIPPQRAASGGGGQQQALYLQT